MGDWTFFSNYGHVLVCLSRNRQTRLRDVAREVGITERAVQKIVRDLQHEGFLTITKQGRCNRYHINKRKSLRHGLESHCTVGKLLNLLKKPSQPQPEIPQKEELPVARAEVDSEIRKPAPEPETTAGKERAGKKPDPVDTRQQGSLF